MPRPTMPRPIVLPVLALVALVTFSRPSASQSPRRPASQAKSAAPFTVVETSISDLRAALEQHRLTSRELVQLYLQRIAIYEDRLNAVITLNPNALQIADSLY